MFETRQFAAESMSFSALTTQARYSSRTRQDLERE